MSVTTQSVDVYTKVGTSLLETAVLASANCYCLAAGHGAPKKGRLSNLIYNETVELDDEMAVTIMKGVAMGIKHLHYLKIPTLTQDDELTPKRVLIDSNYQAQLMHFQLTAIILLNSSTMLLNQH